jgi:hypothetical protein
MSRYTIDRFDVGDFAVLEDELARTVRLPRRWLPPDAREGDVVEALEQDAEPGARILRFRLDPAARDAQRVEAERLRAGVPRAPKGDLSL